MSDVEVDQTEEAEGDQTEEVEMEEDQPPSKKMKTREGEIPTVDAQGQDVSEITGEGDAEEEGEEDDLYAHLGVLKEEDVCITEYISQNKGISAVIKQRYSDFIVNEVSSNGEIVHLTDLTAPVFKEPDPETEPFGPLDEILTEDVVTKLKQVAAGSLSQTSMEAGEDKSLRLRLHRAVKMAFPSIETKTEEEDGVKVITATLKGKGKGKRRGNEYEWPSKFKDFKFCRFTLYKENKNTIDAIHLVSKFLKVKESVFSFAGTKDKRAKTTQELTAFKMHPKRLQNVSKLLRNIMLGNFSYTDKPLKLGDMSGNHFTIVLRNVKGEDEDIETCLNSLKDMGFINYYGLQRFGSQNCSTYEIGRAVLREDWEGAVNLILAGPTPTTNTASSPTTSPGGLAEGSGKVKTEHSKVWRETKDAKATLQKLRAFHHIERRLLHSLNKKPNDYFGAIQSLNRNTRLLYPHSYQSYVWNTVASRRIRTFGFEPVVGDLVLPPGANLTADITDTEEQSSEDQDGNKEEIKVKMSRLQPIVLDEKTVSQYSIYDVVLPLPGFDIIYPANEVHSWYREVMEKDELNIDDMKRKQKDYSLPGSYRYIVMKPQNMDWKIMHYNDMKESLALSDADRLNGVEEPESIPDGKHKAVRVSFTLGLSAYATMALREVLKQDTSPAHQASLNDP